MSDWREEHDSMGAVFVPSDKLWGAQTQRSRIHFPIGTEAMPTEIVHAFGVIKKAAAKANRILLPEKMAEEKCMAICAASTSMPVTARCGASCAAVQPSRASKAVSRHTQTIFFISFSAFPS